MAEEKLVGKVVHYFTNLKVAAIELSGELSVGDTIHIKGATTDLTQKVESMQIDKESVESAKAKQSVGMVVSDHVREHDEVYLVA